MQQITSLKNLWGFTAKGQKNTQYNLSNAKTVIQWGKNQQRETWPFQCLGQQCFKGTVE